MSIYGKPIGGPPAIPDWKETDPTAGGYIKNKPDVLERTGGTMTGALNVLAPTEDANAANKAYVDAKHTYATAELLASGWASSAPYTQTVAVADVLATDSPHISPVYDSDLETALAQQEAWGMVSKAEAQDGSITFTCFEDKPTTDIPIQVEVNR